MWRKQDRASVKATVLRLPRVFDSCTDSALLMTPGSLAVNSQARIYNADGNIKSLCGSDKIRDPVCVLEKRITPVQRRWRLDRATPIASWESIVQMSFEDMHDSNSLRAR